MCRCLWRGRVLFREGWVDMWFWVAGKVEKGVLW